MNTNSNLIPAPSAPAKVLGMPKTVGELLAIDELIDRLARAPYSNTGRVRSK